MSPKIKLTYFDIEGAAENVRLVLMLSGTEFEDERIKFPQWSELKPKTPYGQVPVLTIDGGEYKTQSGAMLRWAGRLDESKGLYPLDKLYEVEEAIGLIQDMQKSWTPCIYLAMSPKNYGHPEDFAKTDEGKAKIKSMREEWIKDHLPRFLKYISDMIDKHGGKFLVGEKPTIADCVAVPALRSFTKGHIDHVDTRCLEINPKITAYVANFCALHELKGHYNDGLGAL